MTPEEIDKLEAGRELDALVAEKVMGLVMLEETYQTWETFDGWTMQAPETFNYWAPSELPPEERMFLKRKHPYFSRSIAAAWQVVEKLKFDPRSPDWDGERDFAIHFNGNVWKAGYYDSGYDNCFDFHAEAKTAPLSICRFALKVVLEPSK